MEKNKLPSPEELEKIAQGVQVTEIVAREIGPDISTTTNISPPINPTSENHKWGRAYHVARALGEKLAIDTLEKFYSTVEEIYKQL